MEPDVLSQLLLGLPNLAVAIWSLWWSFRRLEKMAEMHERLIEKLVARLSAEDTQELRAIVDTARQ